MQNREVLNAKNVADRWDVSVQSLAYLRVSGGGPAYFKIGDGKNSPVRYFLHDIESYESAQLRQSTAENSQAA